LLAVENFLNKTVSFDFKKSEAITSSLLWLIFASSIPQPAKNSIRNVIRKAKLLNMINAKKA
jgi:hypothetical protein